MVRLIGISQPVNLGLIGVLARVSVSLLAWARSHYGHCRLKKMSWRQHFRLSTDAQEQSGLTQSCWDSKEWKWCVGQQYRISCKSQFEQQWKLNQSMRVCLVPTPNCRVWWKQHETAMKLIAQADSLVLTMYSGEDDLHVTYWTWFTCYLLNMMCFLFIYCYNVLYIGWINPFIWLVESEGSFFFLFRYLIYIYIYDIYIYIWYIYIIYIYI